LNWVGLRVDSKETQGLFSKIATAEGVSSNLGRRIWIGWFGRIPVQTVRSEWRGSDGPIWIERSDLVGRTGTVGLHGGARRRVHIRTVLGTGAVANDRVRVRSAQAR
jgi:hypothetical protein